MKRQSYRQQRHNIRKARAGQAPKRDRVPQRLTRFYNAASDLWSKVISLGSQFARSRMWGRSRGVYTPNGKREMKRRWLQNADVLQLNSHKPGTVWPRHLGERPADEAEAA